MFKTIRNAFTNLFSKKETTKDLTRWTSEEESQLVDMIKANVPKTRICSITGRSTNSVNYKLTQMFGSCSVKKLDRVFTKSARKNGKVHN